MTISFPLILVGSVFWHDLSMEKNNQITIFEQIDRTVNSIVKICNQMAIDMWTFSI